MVTGSEASMSKKRSKRKRKESPLRGTLRMAAIFAALIAVNVYFFFLRGGTSLRALLKETEAGKAAVVSGDVPPPRPAPPPAKKPAEEDEGRVVEGVMGEHDTVEKVWRGEGLSAREVAGLSQALGQVFDLRTIRAGHAYTLRFDAEGHLGSVEYRVSPALMFRIARAGDGAWRATREEKPIETRVVEIGGTVGSSLYEAIRRTGESTSLVSWFVDMFAWEMNFYTDCHAGDKYKLIIEKRYLGGRFYKYGRVLAAEYRGRVGTFRVFWFQPKDGAASGEGGGYFTEHGESIVKSLLKTPLKYVRISSGFDRRRFHPILHTERAHLGVDYAAPTGTPVWATASGRVTFAGPRGGAGNTVIIRHGNGIESVYMHLSRFARGLHAGQDVRQKQVIGYVGSTGLSTGPHLHFSLKQNGAFIDPMRYKPERDRPIDPRYRLEFADAIAPRLQRLAAIETRPPDRLMAKGPAPMP